MATFEIVPLEEAIEATKDGCPECGYAPLLGWFNYCPMCGHKLEGTEKEYN